jgi:hypothetical protein
MEMTAKVFLPTTSMTSNLVFFVMQKYPSLIKDSSTI